MSLSRDGPAEDIPQQVSYLDNTAHVIEGRFLHLVKEAAQGAVSLEDFIAELLFLVKDLQRCFRQLVGMKERRDLSFAALRKLQLVEHHYIWLYRKLHLEQAFFRKLHFETKLRGIISADAFAVYQELLDVEEQEREFLRKGDADISRQLLEDHGSPSSEDM